jgi:hypothetical protein
VTRKINNLNKRLDRIVEARPFKKRKARTIQVEPYLGETPESVFFEKYGETIDEYNARLKKEDPGDDGIKLIIRNVVRPEDVSWDKEKGKHVYKDAIPKR